METKNCVLLSKERWLKFKCQSCKLHFKLDAYDVLDSYSLYETAKCPRCSKYAERMTKKTPDIDFIADF